MPGLETFINGIAGLIFIGFWIMAFVILYHLVRFGIGTYPKKLAAIFLLGAIVLFLPSFIIYYSLDLSSILK